MGYGLWVMFSFFCIAAMNVTATGASTSNVSVPSLPSGSSSRRSFFTTPVLALAYFFALKTDGDMSALFAIFNCSWRSEGNIDTYAPTDPGG